MPLPGVLQTLLRQWLPKSKAKSINIIKDKEQAIQRIVSEDITVSWAKVQEWVASEDVPVMPSRGITRRHWLTDELCASFVQEGRMVIPSRNIAELSLDTVLAADTGARHGIGELCVPSSVPWMLNGGLVGSERSVSRARSDSSVSTLTRAPDSDDDFVPEAHPSPEETSSPAGVGEQNDECASSFRGSEPDTTLASDEILSVRLELHLCSPCPCRILVSYVDISSYPCSAHTRQSQVREQAPLTRFQFGTPRRLCSAWYVSRFTILFYAARHRLTVVSSLLAYSRHAASYEVSLHRCPWC